MHFSISTLAAVLSLANPIFASAVECTTNNICRSASGDIAELLTTYIRGINSNRHYDEWEPIACQSFFKFSIYKETICAFMQKQGGAYGRSIFSLAHYIPENGCRVCGKVPFYYPEGIGGYLVYDAAGAMACPDGLCHYEAKYSQRRYNDKTVWEGVD